MKAPGSPLSLHSRKGSSVIFLAALMAVGSFYTFLFLGGTLRDRNHNVRVVHWKVEAHLFAQRLERAFKNPSYGAHSYALLNEDKYKDDGFVLTPKIIEAKTSKSNKENFLRYKLPSAALVAFRSCSGGPESCHLELTLRVNHEKESSEFYAVDYTLKPVLDESLKIASIKGQATIPKRKLAVKLKNGAISCERGKKIFRLSANPLEILCSL